MIAETTFTASASSSPAMPAAAPMAPMMNFLAPQRELMERFLPGLDATLAAIPLQELESRSNPSIGLMRDAKGPALIIPKKYGGLGASAVEGMRILRAIGSRAPSLGIVSTMH